MKYTSVNEVEITSVPEPTSAPARSRVETRRRLLAAGTELFASQGLHRTTTVQIAHRAGVAVGTFYLHFRDKRDLFRRIVFDALAQVRRRMAQAAARAGVDPLAKARARIEEMLAFSEENRSLVRVLFGRDHEAAELGEDVLDDLVLGTEARLRERIAAGASSLDLHPSVMAQALVAAWTRVVAWWVEDPRRAPREAIVETLIRLDPIAHAPGL